MVATSISTGSEPKIVSAIPHRTARLALELMKVECASQRTSRIVDTADMASGGHERGVDVANTTDIHAETRYLCAALLAASSASPGSSRRASGDDSQLMSYDNSTSTADESCATSTSFSDSSEEPHSAWASGVSFWEGGEEKGGDEDEMQEDRQRLGAEARAWSHDCHNEKAREYLTSEASPATADDWRNAAATPIVAEKLQLSSHEGDSATLRNTQHTSGILDEVYHPPLTGTVAAIHGYVASGGDIVFLEKAYNLARDIAASRQSLTVAFDACRLAIAAGYVYSLKKGSPVQARMFALYHSLPKLALSLAPYWTRDANSWSTDAEKLEWNECMLSLLEVASSVSLLSGEPNVLSILEDDISMGVSKAIGDFCAYNPDVLFQYPDVGRECLRRSIAPAYGGHEWRKFEIRLERRTASLGHIDIVDSE